MVCLARLLPLFLVPVISVLPILVDYIMAKVYGVFGWEYRKPAKVQLSCPYKPPAAADHKDKDPKTGVQEESVTPHTAERSSEIDSAVDLIAKDKVWPIDVNLKFMEPVERELKLIGKFMDSAVSLMKKSFIDQ